MHDLMHYATLQGYAPGQYVRVLLEAVPPEFCACFDPRYPVPIRRSNPRPSPSPAPTPTTTQARNSVQALARPPTPTRALALTPSLSPDLNPSPDSDPSPIPRQVIIGGLRPGEEKLALTLCRLKKHRTPRIA